MKLKNEAALQRGAMFDCRCFNIPKEEVTNLIYSRQIDASRNSVQMVGHTYFTDSALHRKNTSMIQDMLHEQIGINWNDLPIPQKRGTACRRIDGKWVIDYEMPILKGEDRHYVDDLINVGGGGGGGNLMTKIEEFNELLKDLKAAINNEVHSLEISLKNASDADEYCKILDAISDLEDSCTGLVTEVSNIVELIRDYKQYPYRDPLDDYEVGYVDDIYSDIEHYKTDAIKQLNEFGQMFDIDVSKAVEFVDKLAEEVK